MRQQKPSDLFIALPPPRLVSAYPPKQLRLSTLKLLSARNLQWLSRSQLLILGPSLSIRQYVSSDRVPFDVGPQMLLTPLSLATTLPSVAPTPLKETTQIIYIFHSILGSLITWPSKPVPSVPFFSIMGACSAPSPPLTQPWPRHV